MKKRAPVQQNRKRTHDHQHAKNGHMNTKGRKESAQNSPKQEKEYHG